MTGMDLYVVIVNDRHTDPQPYLFTTEDAAVAYAKQVAQGWLVELVGGTDGWLHYAEHPTEDDSLWVLRSAVDNPEAKR